MRLFDAHLHIIDPAFSLVVNAGYLPPPFPVEAYRRAVAPLGVAGGAVVSGSFQAFDTAYLRDALRRLGPTYVGVAQLPADISDAEVLALDAAGVRAVRFNLRRGGSAGIEALPRLAHRVWDLARWHAELYVDGRDLPALAPTLDGLPRVVIDHLGLSADGFPHLVRAVERGALVKASGFGRTNLDVPRALRQIADVDAGALLFGTDLPSTRAPRPFVPSDVDTVREALTPAQTEAALWSNAVGLYRLHPAPPDPAV